jgi:hypothetical protein
MSLPNNKLTIVVENPTCADASVENSDASYTNSVPSGGTLILPDSQINVNGVDEGDVVSVKTIDVNLEDSVGDPVTPTSVGLVGNTLTIEVASGSSPSGVLFKFPVSRQRISYRTGDEGSRVQTGWFDYTPPTNPKTIAELDYTSANYNFLLKNNLVVNSVSSKTRFVDVNGVQTFSSTGNANLVLIDKLTGLMVTRNNPLGLLNWDTTIDNALAHSVVVNGVTYDDWYLISLIEIFSIFGYGNDTASVAFQDSATSVNLMSWNTNFMGTATTNFGNTSDHLIWNNNNNQYQAITSAKTLTRFSILVRKAHDLITAP